MNQVINHNRAMHPTTHVCIEICCIYTLQSVYMIKAGKTLMQEKSRHILYRSDYAQALLTLMLLDVFNKHITRNEGRSEIKQGTKSREIANYIPVGCGEWNSRNTKSSSH
jgi:hypothetical protein